MPRDRRYRSLLGVLVALLPASLGMACSSSALHATKDAAAADGSGGSGGAASGGTTGPIGTVGSGGTTAAGGGAGLTGTGGREPPTGGKTASTTGGRTGAGGTTRALGGATGVGGAMATGDVAGMGGALGTGGGADAKGGAPGTGGARGTGGTTGAGGGTCAPSPVASSPLITFNSDGSWFAYQDERAVVDVKGGKLVVGSVAFGSPRGGDIEAVIYDLATGKAGAPAKLGNLPMDEHNAPALAIRPDGKYVAAWASHRIDCNTYYSIYDGSTWGAPMTFDWQPVGCPWNADAGMPQMTTYANLWTMDGTLFDFVRAVDTSPNALASTDDGVSWSYHGRLTATPTTGYVAGYYKFWGNHIDRVDFLGTEAHPRDFDNNLWHGYVQGGKIHNSVGTVIDEAFAGPPDASSAQDIAKYTKVFAAGSTVGTVKLEHAWNYDIVRYEDGTIAILGQGRVSGTGTDDPDKRSFYGRFDGARWTLTYLAKMGPKLNSSEQDYTGMGALHPDDPTTVFIATPYDPRDDTTKASKHEIWRGTTCDNGATFQWTPITTNSTMSNIRPIVPKWDRQHTALLWLRGNFSSAASVTASVVGIISAP